MNLCRMGRMSRTLGHGGMGSPFSVIANGAYILIDCLPAPSPHACPDYVCVIVICVFFCVCHTLMGQCSI